MKAFAAALIAALAMLAVPLGARAETSDLILPQTIAVPMLDALADDCQLPASFDYRYEITCISFKDDSAVKTLASYSRVLEERGWRRDLRPRQSDVLVYTRPVGPCSQTAFLFLQGPSDTLEGSAFAVQRRPVCNGGAAQ